MLVKLRELIVLIACGEHGRRRLGMGLSAPGFIPNMNLSAARSTLDASHAAACSGPLAVLQLTVDFTLRAGTVMHNAPSVTEACK